MKGGARLYSQLSALYEWLHDSDGPVTQGMREIQAEHAKELARLSADWRELVGKDVAQLNRQASLLELPTLYVPPEPEVKKK